MSFGSLLVHEYRAITTTLSVTDHQEPLRELEPWQLHTLESFVLAPGPAWRLLRALFTRDAEDTNLQDELGKLAQR